MKGMTPMSDKMIDLDKLTPLQLISIAGAIVTADEIYKASGKDNPLWDEVEWFVQGCEHGATDMGIHSLDKMNRVFEAAWQGLTLAEALRIPFPVGNALEIGMACIAMIGQIDEQNTDEIVALETENIDSEWENFNA